jgi:hypothetical protein
VCLWTANESELGTLSDLSTIGAILETAGGMITPAGMPWDANRSRKIMRAWTDSGDSTYGIYRVISRRQFDHE